MKFELMIKRIKNILGSQKPSEASRRRGKVVLILLAFMLLGYGLMSCSGSKDTTSSNSVVTPPSEPPDTNSETTESDKIKELTKSLEGSEELSKFSHNNEYHSQLSCLICHRRDNNSPRISMPGGAGHTPCIGCHTQQFEDVKSPICSICHTDAEKGFVKRFPPLRSFNVRFNHARHTKKTRCATCHKPTRRGVAKSIPSGAGAHASCFQCHSSKAAHNMSSCSLCHQPGRKGRAISESAKAYSVSFSHANHKLACTNCHKVLRGGSRGRQVTAPLASMHFAPRNRQSCATCHNNKRAFGGDDFADCKRCHQGNSFKFR